MNAQKIAGIVDKHSDRSLRHGWWGQRPGLALIRDAAYSRCVSPDAVLAALLTRVAAEAPRGTRGDAGAGPFALNLLAALIGPPAAGKSEAVKTAEALMPFTDPDLVTRGLGSGEGLAELFMGDGKDADGKKIRTQIRDRAHIYCDEGEALFIQGQRKGATIGPTLRTAFTGGLLGNANASKETSRHVTDYALGAIFGFQPEVLAPLLDEAAQGTPQRFLFASALCPSMPEERAPWPNRTIQPPSTYTDERFREDGRTYTLPGGVQKLILSHRVAVQRGEAKVEPLDAHRGLLTAKVAVLLHILTGDPSPNVTEEDWQLALDVVATSAAVRGDIVDLSLRNQEAAQAAANERAAARKKAEDKASHAERIDRLAKRLLLHTAKAGGRITPGRLRANGLNRHERGDYSEALIVARSNGWLTEEAGHVVIVVGRT